MSERAEDGSVYGFHEGQRVRMLIETSGDDENCEFRTFPAGVEAEITRIDYYPNSGQNWSFTVSINDTITNLLDELDGPIATMIAPLETT